MKGTPQEQYKYCSECLFYINKTKKLSIVLNEAYTLKDFIGTHFWLINVQEEKIYVYFIFLLEY